MLAYLFVDDLGVFADEELHERLSALVHAVPADVVRPRPPFHQQRPSVPFGQPGLERRRRAM
jgi:hypothetical protein